MFKHSGYCSSIEVVIGIVASSVALRGTTVRRVVGVGAFAIIIGVDETIVKIVSTHVVDNFSKELVWDVS